MSSIVMWEHSTATINFQNLTSNFLRFHIYPLSDSPNTCKQACSYTLLELIEEFPVPTAQVQIILPFFPPEQNRHIIQTDNCTVARCQYFFGLEDFDCDLLKSLSIDLPGQRSDWRYYTTFFAHFKTLLI
jgi:hypothetical protein